ncbi:MAG: hypothetical protein ACOYM2_16915 [Rectinemataceae bacterium]
MDDSSQASTPAAGTDPRLTGAELEFPLTFDLRMIYLKDEGSTIVEDLEAIYKAREVSCAMIQGIGIPGSKYARMGSRLTFTSREQMYGTYEDIGKLPYIKSAI